MSSITWADLLSRSREARHQLLLIDKSRDGKCLHMYAHLGNAIVAATWPWKGNYRQTFLFRHPNGKRKFSIILIFFLLPPGEMVPFVLLTRHRKVGREGRGGEEREEKRERFSVDGVGQRNILSWNRVYVDRLFSEPDDGSQKSLVKEQKSLQE